MFVYSNNDHSRLIDSIRVMRRGSYFYSLKRKLNLLLAHIQIDFKKFIYKNTQCGNLVLAN